MVQGGRVLDGLLGGVQQVRIGAGQVDQLLIGKSRLAAVDRIGELGNRFEFFRMANVGEFGKEFLIRETAVLIDHLSNWRSRPLSCRLDSVVLYQMSSSKVPKLR